RLQFGKKELTAIVNLTAKVVPKGNIGVYGEVRNSLDLKENEDIEVEVAKFPSSLSFIRSKLKGRKLSYEEIYEIVKDTVEGNLSEIEIASFVTALHTFGLDLDEAASLSLAMVRTGKTLELERKPIVDKHSIGGAVGDKTTLLVVPIVAAAGLTIPKTSSRAITSASGSADRAEVLMPVNLDVDDMKRVVEKTNGCIVWGGALNLAPADDIFIQVEYPLEIDPLMLPSIMSKKKAVNAEFLVVDIPCGRGTKIKTIGDANILSRDFIELGKKLGIKTQCAITYGEQPIGYTIGPALEAKEALEVLMKRKVVPDLIDKSTDIAGILLEMTGIKNGKAVATELLRSGKAEQKLREIIFEQGGDPEIKPEDIKIGDYGLDICSDSAGVVLWINNSTVLEVARAAGSPKDKGAGVLLYKKVGDTVKKDEKLFTVYTEKSRKLERVQKILDEEKIFGVGDRMEMLIKEVKEVEVTKKAFMLER
ncbi:MAG: AMP phosphorylase, partial [Candidatus Aenigmarchaeota archaeon]|nr:AMP phosphorylase [Candidatus Aenigmarchaeota archaeon]